MARRLGSWLLCLAILASCGGSSTSASLEPVDPSRTPQAISTPATSPRPERTDDAVPTGDPVESLTPPATQSPVESLTPLGDPFRPAQQPAGFVSQIACTGPIGASDPVAIVRPHAAVAGFSADPVLYDYADAGNPRIACTFGKAWIVQLIDARHVVIDGGHYTYAVVDLPEVRYHWFGYGYGTVAPRLDAFVWLKSDRTLGFDGIDEVHITTSSADVVVASLPNDHYDRCGTTSQFAEYTRSGSHFFVLDQSDPALDSLLVVEGQTPVLSVLPPSGGWAENAEPGVAVWSPTSETLFYRQGGGAWQWRPTGGAQRFLPGVSWSQATVSGDGAYLAYSVARPDGSYDTYIVDLRSPGSPQLIGTGGRGAPAFLNATKLWYMAEGESTCGGYGSDVPLIYDVTDASESPSPFDAVLAAWPATNSRRP